MDLALSWLSLFLPWIAVFGLLFLFFRLVIWAKNKKTSILLLGAFMQMVLPDPYAERTIHVVQERKQDVKKAEDENGDPPTDEQ